MSQPDLFGALPPPPKPPSKLDLARQAFTEFREVLRASIYLPPTNAVDLLRLEEDIQFALTNRFGHGPKNAGQLAALCIRGTDVFMNHHWEDGTKDTNGICRRCKRISK
jgi:hypothetical protein